MFYFVGCVAKSLLTDSIWNLDTSLLLKCVQDLDDAKIQNFNRKEASYEFNKWEKVGRISTWQTLLMPIHQLEPLSPLIS